MKVLILVVGLVSIFLHTSDSFGVSFGHIRNFRCTFANSLLKDFIDFYDEIIISKIISFYVYTNENEEPELATIINRTYVSDTFNASKPTRVIIHGFWNSHNSQINKALQPIYTSSFDVNVVVVSYTVIARDSCYKIARKRVNVIGRRIAMFLDDVIGDDKWQWENLVLVGHSLGAHVAGVVGRSVKRGRVRTIVALDMAGPGFEMKAKNPNRLRKEDADFVECIHTNGNSLGLYTPICSVDIYPNYGLKQPGCVSGVTYVPVISDLCAHSRAWELYAESLTSEFTAYQCENMEEMKRNECNGTEIVMGGDDFEEKRNLTGIFFLETNEKSPFAIN